MNSLNVLIARFHKLHLRERVLAVAAVMAILYFIVDVALLKGEQEKIKVLQELDKAHKIELASVNKALAEAEKNAPAVSEQLSRDRATLDEFEKQIANADALLDQVGATSSQVGALLRELLDASPGMTLVSLKTLPVATFYSPQPQVKAGGSVDADKETTKVQVQKTIYRHGVEVSVKGNYLALLSYMENLQKNSKRLFWSEARLDVSVYPDAVLKLVIYSLSDQSSSPLR